MSRNEFWEVKRMIQFTELTAKSRESKKRKIFQLVGPYLIDSYLQIL